MITPEALRKYCRQLTEEQAKVHAAALEKARQSSSVNNPRRLVHIMGQMFVECGAFARLEESFKYKPDRLDAVFKNVKGLEHAKALLAKGDEAVGNCVYANRNGNGDEASGDGFKYRGSGYIQLTGRENYRKFGEIAGEDLETKPELARNPDTAARVAFAYWDAKGLSKLADAGDLEGITKKINGPAMLAFDERRKAVFKAIDVWGA
jgi:putative chitinase